MTVMTDTRRVSPLAHRAAQTTDDGAASIQERPFQGKLILRGDAGRIGERVAGVLGAALPVIAGGVAMGGRAEAQWLGPDEWLLIADAGAEPALVEDLGRALAGQHAQLVIVTDNYTTIALTGSRAREMLLKIATIDFHPRAFNAGQGITSNFGRTIAFVRQLTDDATAGGPTFDLVVRSSMADYLWCLLCEAGHEWGLVELDPKGMVRQHLPHFQERP